MLFFRLLEGAVATKPLTYARLVANAQSKATPVPPATRRVAPDSLVRAVPARPWRR